MNGIGGTEVVGETGARVRLVISRVSAIIAVGLLFATQLLISPDPQASYPGETPWSSFSLLRPLTQIMSLGGLVSTARGVEIKDLALHVAAVALLILMAARAAAAARFPVWRRGEWGAWLVGQILLLGWGAVSLASVTWSAEPDIAAAQATIYLLYAGLAIGLAWTLEPRDLRLIVWGVIGSATTAAILCIWYFCERNWQHRPGFPTGNPGVLAATLLPGVIASACILRQRIVSWRAARPGERTSAMIVALALAAMVACLVLTGARSALMGLCAALLGLLAIATPPRLRWGLLGAGVTLVVGVGVYFYSTRLDTLMARGATIRFRTYMWRYAADIWTQRPVSGAGAGAFSYLSGGLGVRNRALDPAAFMGDWAGHAHNELFEVLAEIGLLGGVTFVGAWVASFAGALEILRAPLSAERRALVLGLLGGLLALLAEMMFGVSLRLPGVPAYLFVCVGSIWALGRASATAGDTPRDSPDRRRAVARACVAGAALLAAGAAGWMTVRNWSGVCAEFAAQRALRGGDAPTAAIQSQRAAELLLDPIRRLYAEEWAVRARLALAEAAFEASRAGGSMASQPSEAAQAMKAEQLASAAYEAALALDRRAPTLMSMPATAARCAEMLTALLSQRDPRAAVAWYERAEAAWRLQRRQSPFDVDALLALENRYAAVDAGGTLGVRVELLRDALRGGLADARWQRAFERCAGVAGFPAELNGLLARANPIDPRTGVDALVVSMAPEAFRLAAAYHALRGEFGEATRFASRAAELYAPMKPRFPELRAVGLLEQAEYEFRGAERGCGAAVELADRAIAELPTIQPQQYGAMAEPYRARRLLYLLAGGREAEVRALLEESGAQSSEPGSAAAALAQRYVALGELLIRQQPARRAEVLGWLDAATRLSPQNVRAWAWKCWDAAERREFELLNERLGMAEQAGVPPAAVGQIRQSLAQEFPELADRLAP